MPWPGRPTIGPNDEEQHERYHAHTLAAVAAAALNVVPARATP